MAILVALLSCGSLKYGSLIIFVTCLLLGTWGTNHYAGINFVEERALEKMRPKTVVAPKNKSKPREAPLWQLDVTLLPTLEEISPPEPHKALQPKLMEVPLPEAHEALLPKLRKESESQLQEVPQQELREFPQPVLPEVSQAPLKKIPQPELREVSQPKFPEVPQAQLQEVPTPELREVHQPESPELPQLGLQEIPQPERLGVSQLMLPNVSRSKLRDVPQPKFPEVSQPLVRRSKRDNPLVSTNNEDLEPTIDLNCTGPCAKSFDETMKRLAMEDGERHEADLNDINVFLQTVFQNLSHMDYESDIDLFRPISKPADTPGAKNETLYDKLLKKSRGSLAAAAIFSIMWTASIYGLTSMATGVKELLIAPALLFVVASVTCIGLVFVDLGVIEVNGLHDYVLYVMIFLGTLFKIVVAVIFLYCFFVVYNYYKELRDRR